MIIYNLLYICYIAAKYIKGVAIHRYGNAVSGPDTLDQTHQKFPDHFILATEAYEANWSSPVEAPSKYRVSMGNWHFGQTYAHDIIRDLTHWAIGWVHWNMVLDQNGGPNWAKNNASAPIIANPSAKEYYKNPMYYALGHFSKFLPPGSKRVGISPEIIDDDNLQCGMLQRTDGGNMMIVVNSHNEIQAFVVEDPDFGQLKMQIQPNSFDS